MELKTLIAECTAYDFKVMLEIIDTYWEAQGINVKNSRNT